jgi:hypothetical protein
MRHTALGLASGLESQDLRADPADEQARRGPVPDALQGRVPRALDAWRVTESPRREPVKRSRSSDDERLLSRAVESHQLEIGRWYAYREKRGPRYPMVKVRLLDKVGRKGKMMELAADPGLNLLTFTAEPGSKSDEALNLLGSWTATVEQEQTAPTAREA